MIDFVFVCIGKIVAIFLAWYAEIKKKVNVFIYFFRKYLKILRKSEGSEGKSEE
jgi:hypothetical protein